MFEVFLVALALSMDAFAVSISLGIKQKAHRLALAFKAALFFGGFQIAMSLLGHLSGMGLIEYIDRFDHWIALGLLSLIGTKMIYDSFHQGIEHVLKTVSTRLLLVLAIATSIDALAAGFSLRLLNASLFVSLALIGTVTFVLSFWGVWMGYKGGKHFEKKAEFFGGAVLIAVGLKIVLTEVSL